MQRARQRATQPGVVTKHASKPAWSGEGPRPEAVAAARAEVASARASLAGLEQTARDLTLTSTIGGTVLSRHAEPGEVLSPGISGMTLGDVTQPYVRGSTSIRRRFP